MTQSYNSPDVRDAVIDTLQELMADWQAGKISDVAALYAVCLIVYTNQPPTQNDIEWAEKIYPRIVQQLKLGGPDALGKLAAKHQGVITTD